MRREFLKHKRDYMVLMLGLGIITILFLGAWPNLVWQRLIIVSMSFFYFGWGMMTHFKTDHISKRVVYEYLGMSVLAGLLLFLVTL